MQSVVEVKTKEEFAKIQSTHKLRYIGQISADYYHHRLPSSTPAKFYVDEKGTTYKYTARSQEIVMPQGNSRMSIPGMKDSLKINIRNLIAGVFLNKNQEEIGLLITKTRHPLTRLKEIIAKRQPEDDLESVYTQYVFEALAEGFSEFSIIYTAPTCELAENIMLLPQIISAPEESGEAVLRKALQQYLVMKEKEEEEENDATALD